MSEKTQNSGAPTKLWNKAFIMVVILGIFTQGSSMMVTTLIAKYATKVLGAELTIAATLSATMSIVALCCRPFSGLVADRLNRKTIMIVSVVVTALCVLGYGVFPNVSALFAFRIIHGAAFAFMGVANVAFGTSFIPDDKIGEGMAYLSLGAILASAVGPGIGLSISEKYGYNVVFIVTALILAGALVLLIMIPYKQPERTGAAKKFDIHSLIEPRVILLACVLMLFSSGNGLMNTYAALLGEERGITNIALFFTAYSFSTFACRPIVGKLFDKKGLTFVMVPAIILAGCAMGCISIAQGTGMVVLAGFLKAAGQGSATSSVNASAIKKLGKSRAGVISSTCYIGQDIGNAFAPIIGSYIVKSYSYGALFASYACLMVAGGLAFYGAYLLIEKKIEEKAQKA